MTTTPPPDTRAYQTRCKAKPSKTMLMSHNINVQCVIDKFANTLTMTVKQLRALKLAIELVGVSQKQKNRAKIMRIVRKS